jgi:hypothetical protein
MAFVVSVLVMAVIRVWSAGVAAFDYRYLAYGQRVLASVSAAAFAVAVAAGLIMLALLVVRAWERLGSGSEVT